MAAYLLENGSSVGLWSRNYTHHEVQPDGTLLLTTTGAVEGTFSVPTIPTLAGIADYDIAVIALPATAYADLLPALAGHLGSNMSVIFSGSLSLAPLWLHEMAQARGQSPTIIAWGTTLLAGHFQATGALHIPFVRKTFDVAALPAQATPDSARLCAEVFGIEFGQAGSVLDVCLSNINPIAHAGQMIGNFSRIDRQENWLLFEHFSRSGINVAESLDRERLAIAKTFGATPRSLQQHYALSYRVEDAPIADMVRQIYENGSRTRGPRSLDHRYLIEDMPYGLAFLERLAACADLDCPVTSAVITLLEIMTDCPIRQKNRILDQVFFGEDSIDSITERCLGRSPAPSQPILSA